MLDRFTKQARAVVVDAEREARTLGAPAVGPEHLLIAVVERCQIAFWPGGYMLRVGDRPEPPLTAEHVRELVSGRDPDAEALAAIGISLTDVRRKVEETFGPGAWDAPRRRRRLPFTAEAKKALELALREAVELRTRRLVPEHILLGLLRQDGPARRLVEQLGHDPEVVRTRLRSKFASLAL